jgi:hypothetical protein
MLGVWGGAQESALKSHHRLFYADNPQTTAMTNASIKDIKE